jgi:replication factor C subunit 1
MNQPQELASIWTEKYRPQVLTDYYITKKQLDVVKKWIRDYRDNTDDIKPFLILYGTAGIGKTTLAHLILKKYNYEIIECNASDFRSKKNLSESIGQISSVSICVDDTPIPKSKLQEQGFKKTAVIMDEIDGLTGGESGGVQELLDIIVSKKANSKEFKYLCPVVCTTNSIREKKLQGIIKQGVVLNINKPSPSDCKKLIDRIVEAENIKSITPQITDDIITKANGDFRQLIYNLYEFYLNSKNIIKPSKEKIGESHESLMNLDVNFYDNCDDFSKVIKLDSNLGDSPLDKINHFLTNSTSLDDIKYICSGDSNLFYLNLYFNISSIISAIQTKTGTNKTKEQLLANLKELVTVYNCINTADSMNNAIFTNKNWELLELFDYLGLAIPIKLMSQLNIKSKLPSGCYIAHVPKFNLQHHTPYNYMRQEQSTNNKMLNVDFMKTHEKDPTNIYYYLKTFQAKHKSKMSTKQGTKKQMQQNIYNIDKKYLKILEKMDMLLK